MKTAYQCSETSFRYSPHARSVHNIGRRILLNGFVFLLFQSLCYFGHNIFHGTMEPDGCTVWSITGVRKYMLHLLRVGFGRNLMDTLEGLLSASENICCICFFLVWLEPGGDTFWFIVGFRTYVLHLLRVWFGRNLTARALRCSTLMGEIHFMISGSGSPV